MSNTTPQGTAGGASQGATAIPAADDITAASVDTFLARLAGADPTPGGGSAAAIMGAMGAALVSMVCNVSLGRKSPAPDPGLPALLAESERLRLRLTAMVAEDVAVFEALMRAYRLPKTPDEEKAHRAVAIQASLRRATEVPLDCARACAAVVTLARRATDLGYRGVISDAGVGSLSAFTALRSAALNVYINVPTLQDRGFAEAAEGEIGALIESCGRENEAVYRAVREKIAG